MRSTVASMVYWAKSNTDLFAEKANEIIHSGGPKRRAFLQHYMILQSPEKKAKSTETTKRRIGFDRTRWRSCHFVAQRVGKEKLDFWIENKVIETQECSRTGSTKKKFQEYCWSEDTKIGEAVFGTHQTLNRKHSQRRISGNERRRSRSRRSTRRARAARRSRPRSSVCRNRKTWTTFLANPNEELINFQTLLEETKAVEHPAEAPDVKFEEPLAASCGTWVQTAQRSFKLLESIATVRNNKDTVPEVLKQIRKLDGEHKEHVKHAEAFGLGSKMSNKRYGKR